MSLLSPATIQAIPGLQAALAARAALTGADFTGVLSAGGGTVEFSGLGLGTAYSQRLNATWANGATTFTALQVNVTDAASAAGSNLLELRVGGVSKLLVGKSGALALTGSVSIGGGVVTASDPIQSGAQTWNNAAATFVGLVYNFTDTASASDSLLADLKVGGVSKFSISKTGDVTAAFALRSSYGIFGANLSLNSNGGRFYYGAESDTYIGRPAAGVLELKNYPSEQFASLRAAGTTLTGGVVTASVPLQSGSQTWNNAAVTFVGIEYNFTDTASASGSLLLDLKVGGVSNFSVSKTGDVTAAFALRSSYAILDANVILKSDSGKFYFGLNYDTYIELNSTGVLGIKLGATNQFAKLRTKLQLETAAAPASATDTGVAGETRWDAAYLYLCTATDTWKRAALATW